MRHDTPSSFDAIVIGGSYAGLSGAMQLARAGRPICVVDSGTPRNRFSPAAHGFFGQDGMAPGAMIKAARDKLAAYPCVSFREAEVRGAAPDAGGFTVTLGDGDARLTARKLLLAFGVHDEMPPLPGLAERWGTSVLHCPYCHGYEFRDGPIGVLADGAMSVMKAELVADWGPTTLFLDGQPAPDAEAAARLDRAGVRIEPAPVVAVEGEGPAMSGLRLADGRLVPVAALFVAPRQRLRSGVAEELGCALDDGPFGPIVRVDQMRRTTVAGVYAAGDITTARQNATLASADGVLAGANLHQALVFGT